MSDYPNSGLTGYVGGTVGPSSHTHSFDAPPPAYSGVEELKRIQLAQIAKQAMENLMAERKAQEAKPMRGLFEVFIVEPESGEIMPVISVVAKDESAAKLKAVRSTLSDDADMDDYDIIVRRLGDVRAKRSVQEVKLVTE